jgi:tripartite-type tricarboxylate transporter receptor subunit TctC
VGSVLHLCGVLLAQKTGVELLHIAYKGTGPSLTDLLGGQIDSVFSNLPAVVPQIKSGKMRALAVTSAERDGSVPDVPTMIEAGIPGYTLTSWFGIFAPAETPRAAVLKVNAEVSRLIQLPEVRQRLLALGALPTPRGADEANPFFHDELARLGAGGEGLRRHRRLIFRPLSARADFRIRFVAHLCYSRNVNVRRRPPCPRRRSVCPRT